MKRKTESPGAAIFNRLIVLGFIITGAFSSFSSFASVLTNEPQAAQSKTDDSRERFDYLVREAFLSGYAGDQAALDRGMKVCEDALANNPNHAEALV